MLHRIQVKRPGQAGPGRIEITGSLAQTTGKLMYIDDFKHGSAKNFRLLPILLPFPELSQAEGEIACRNGPESIDASKIPLQLTLIKVRPTPPVFT